MPKTMTYVANNKFGISKDLVETENDTSSSKHMFGFIGDILFNAAYIEQFEKDFVRTDIRVVDDNTIYESKASNKESTKLSDIEHERIKNKNVRQDSEKRTLVSVSNSEVRKRFMGSKEYSEKQIISKISKLTQTSSGGGISNILAAISKGECEIKVPSLDSQSITSFLPSNAIIQQNLTRQGSKYIYKMVQPIIPSILYQNTEAGIFLDKETGKLVKISDYTISPELQDLFENPKTSRLTYPGKIEITMELDLTPGKEIQFSFSNKLILDNAFDVKLKDGKKVVDDSENMIFKTNRVKVHNDPIKNLKIIKHYINKSLPRTLNHLKESNTEEEYMANLKILKRRLSKLEFYIDSAGSNKPQIKKVIDTIKSKIKTIEYITQHHNEKLSGTRSFIYKVLNKVPFANFFQTELDTHKKVSETMDSLKEADSWKFIEDAKSALPEIEGCLALMKDQQSKVSHGNVNILSNIPDKKISVEEQIKHDEHHVKAKLTTKPNSHKI